MPFDVSAINNIKYRQFFFNTNKDGGQKFVQNAYAVKGNLEHPERRTDTDGQNIYFLA